MLYLSVFIFSSVLTYCHLSLISDGHLLPSSYYYLLESCYLSLHFCRCHLSLMFIRIYIQMLLVSYLSTSSISTSSYLPLTFCSDLSSSHHLTIFSYLILLYLHLLQSPSFRHLSLFIPSSSIIPFYLPLSFFFRLACFLFTPYLASFYTLLSLSHLSPLLLLIYCHVISHLLLSRLPRFPIFSCFLFCHLFFSSFLVSCHLLVISSHLSFAWCSCSLNYCYLLYLPIAFLVCGPGSEGWGSNLSDVLSFSPNSQSKNEVSKSRSLLFPLQGGLR